MAWKTGPNSPLGVSNANPAIPDTPTTAPYPYVLPLGTIATFFEDTQGPAELIYLPGIANLVSGDVVEYDLTPGAQLIVRHSNATGSNSGRPIAVAVGAPQAGQYGWFQISGVAIVNVTAGSAVGAAFATATAGSLNSAADAGDQIMNTRLVTAIATPAAGKAYLMLNRPCVQGQIT